MENNKVPEKEKEPTLNEVWYAPEDFQANSRKIFLAFIVLGVVGFLFAPWLALFAFVVLAYMIYTTLLDPRCKFFPRNVPDKDIDSPRLEYFSLYGPIGTVSSSDSYNKMIDVLISGGVIDKNTTEGDFFLEVINVDPPVYKVGLNQIGKTEKQLVSACESSILAFGAYVVDVIEKGGYFIVSYKVESDLDVLAGRNILYSDLVVVFENE